MNTRLLPGTLLLFMISVCSIQAQVSTYTFQSDNIPYTELVSGNQLGDSLSEDEYFTDPSIPMGSSTQSGIGIPIGFNFIYNGFSYDVFGVSVNGWIGLGNGSVNLNSISPYYPLSSSTGSNFIAGFGRNLQGQNGSSLSYATLGSSPNQVLVIQWKDFRKHGNIGDRFNFQIRLYEGSNRVEFHYGQMQCNINASFVTVGMIGNDSSDFNLRGTNNGGWANTISGVSNTATCTLNPSTLPDNGLRFWWIAPPPCTSPPTPGIASSSLPTVCPNNPFIVSLSGNSSGPGQTYQWQSSADSLNWNDITGATTLSYSSTQVSATWFRCSVTCSGQTAYSEPVFVDFSPPTLCYCTTNLGGDCMGYGSIDSVRIVNTTLANLGTGCSNLTSPNYSDYAPGVNTTTTLLLNSTYDLRVTTTFNAIVSVWFDFDRSGTFDPTEWYQVNVSASPNVVSSTLFIVPGTASVGTTKMRIRCRAAGTPNGAIDACTNFFSGETEDYTITLDDGTRIQSYESEASLFLAYPNPATDHISLQPRTALHNAKIEIHDLNGKSEYSNSSENIMQGSSTEIDLIGLSSGIYILTCRSNEGIQHHRIQVIR